MIPHFRGLRVGKPYKTWDGTPVVRVSNSANTTLFLVIVHENQVENVKALVAELNMKTKGTK